MVSWTQACSAGDHLIPRKPRLLVSLYNAEQEYQRMQVGEAHAAAARLGLEVTIVFCNDSTALQKKQIEAALQEPSGTRPVAMVVQPYAAAGLEAVAKEALTAGIGWVLMGPSFYVDSLRQEFPGKLVALVTTDHRQIGILQGKVFRALLPGGGKVLCIEGPSLSPAVMLRREGLRSELQGSRITVARTLTGDWGEESGEKTTTFWLKLGSGSERPDLVGAQNDSMAIGARRAFLAVRPEWADVPFTGCDGLPSGGKRLVDEKVLAATVVQPTTAGPAIGVAAAALRGQPWEPITSIAPSVYPALEQIERSRGR